MASYVKFELDDGTIIYVETTETPKGSSGLIPGKGAEHAEQAAVSFDQSVDAIRKMASSMIQNIRSGFVEQPSEIAVNFGLKASADLGTLVVARGGVEANYNVSLRWHRDKDKEKEKDQDNQKEETQAPNQASQKE